MAFCRTFVVVGLLSGSWLVTVGCGSDDVKKTSGAEAGEAGEPGAGTASGGSSNNIRDAGEGGNASGGDAGAGVLATGGTGGDTGAAGASESAAAGGVGGVGNAGNAGGEGGHAPAVKALACHYECISDSDCEKPGPVTDTSNKCNQVTKRCENPREACVADGDCLPFVSEWGTECLDDGDCAPDIEACVASNGKGYCAALPDANFPEFPCILGVLLTRQRFGSEGQVDVCGSPDPRCFDGKCAAGCQDPDKGGCEQGEGLSCNHATGRCECKTGAECASNICEGSVCVECGSSADCDASASSTGLDTCVNGKCSCSGSQVCPDGGFESATAVCE